MSESKFARDVIAAADVLAKTVKAAVEMAIRANAELGMEPGQDEIAIRKALATYEKVRGTVKV